MTNDKNLPVAKINPLGWPSILNPEILTWTDRDDGKKEGRGFVWIEETNPITVLDPDTFEPIQIWGERRLGIVAIGDGRYGPMVIDPPQEGDRRWERRYPAQ